MKKILGYYLFTLIVASALCLSANTYGQEEYEDLLESEEETSDQSELLERMAELRENPIDLNTASAIELQRIPWLSPVQAQKIVKSREKCGRFRSLQDLRGVPGVDEELIDSIKSLVKVKTVRGLPFLSVRHRTRILQGGSSEDIEGNKFLFKEKVYVRSEASLSGRVKISLLTEKDADERCLDDHAVYSLSIDRWHMFDKILFGNYRLGFGQGLVLGEYSGAFKGASFPSSLKKRERGIGANTSTSEAGPFFGFAWGGSLGDFEISIFGSRAKVDATLNPDSTVSSIYESGYHRTETERGKKDALRENVFGAHISYGRGSLGSVGVTFYRSGYDHLFDPKDRERKRFTFRGGSNTVAGIDVDLYCRRLNLFGEASRAADSGSGTLIGAIIDFDRVEVDALVREYSRDFYNVHNYAFAEKPDETQNESGALLGFVCRPDSKTTLRTYFDRMKRPWRGYYEKMPPLCEEFWTQVEHRVAKHILSTVRFRLKNKETNKSVGDGESKNTRRQQINVRGQIDWEFSKKGRLRGRCENVWVRYPDLSDTEVGWIYFGDLRLFPVKWLSLENRCIFFKTDSYDSRIYDFENDLPGLTTNLGLYGEGLRWYVLAKVKLGRTARISFKYSSTRFSESDKKDDGRFGIQFECNPAF